MKLLTGRGAFIADISIPSAHHVAILRSPYAHARVRGIDTSAVLREPGVAGVVTGADAARLTQPFSVGVEVPVKYYCMATDKVRFVGEPVAALVVRDRYTGEDALDLIQVEYDPLPAVFDPERALECDAPVLHEDAGSNLPCHRHIVCGDPERAFREADVVIRERFHYPKYSLTPIETYGVTVSWERTTAILMIGSNFMGPFILHALVARSRSRRTGCAPGAARYPRQFRNQDEYLFSKRPSCRSSIARRRRRSRRWARRGWARPVR